MDTRSILRSLPDALWLFLMAFAIGLRKRWAKRRTGADFIGPFAVLQAAMRRVFGGTLMSITSDLIRGHTETIILAQLAQKDSYGYEINKKIQELTDGEYELKEATLYSTFRRLEKSEMIHSYWGDQATGARRRYYEITDLGRQQLERSREEWKQSKVLIDRMILGG